MDEAYKFVVDTRNAILTLMAKGYDNLNQDELALISTSIMQFTNAVNFIRLDASFKYDNESE